MWKIQLRCSLIQECPSSNIFHTILIKICSNINQTFQSGDLNSHIEVYSVGFRQRQKRFESNTKEWHYEGFLFQSLGRLFPISPFPLPAKQEVQNFGKLYFKKLRLLINYPSCSHWYVPRQFYELQAILLKNYLPEWTLIM